MNMVFGGSTALAGLILVFLGSIFTSFESYHRTERDAVRSRIQIRAYLAFSGFVFALFASALSLGHQLDQGDWMFAASLTSLAVSAILLLLMGVLTLRDLHR